jgi:hypothetical protein
MTTQAEELAALKTRIAAAKTSFFERARLLARMSADELTTCGYRGKSPAEAVLISLQRQDAEIESWLRAFERKYP